MHNSNDCTITFIISDKHNSTTDINYYNNLTHIYNNFYIIIIINKNNSVNSPDSTGRLYKSSGTPCGQLLSRFFRIVWLFHHCWKSSMSRFKSALKVYAMHHLNVVQYKHTDRTFNNNHVKLINLCSWFPRLTIPFATSSYMYSKKTRFVT